MSTNYSKLFLTTSILLLAHDTINPVYPFYDYAFISTYYVNKYFKTSIYLF